jgi:hypothetical protein
MGMTCACSIAMDAFLKTMATSLQKCGRLLLVCLLTAMPFRSAFAEDSKVIRVFYKAPSQGAWGALSVDVLEGPVRGRLEADPQLDDLGPVLKVRLERRIVELRGLEYALFDLKDGETIPRPGPSFHPRPEARFAGVRHIFDLSSPLTDREIRQLLESHYPAADLSNAIIQHVTTWEKVRISAPVPKPPPNTEPSTSAPLKQVGNQQRRLMRSQFPPRRDNPKGASGNRSGKTGPPNVPSRDRVAASIGGDVTKSRGTSSSPPVTSPVTSRRP